MRPVAAGVPNVVYSRPMTNARMKRLLTVLATLAASAIFAVGCGGDDNDGGGGGGDQNPVSGGTQDAPDNKDEAVDRCYEEAKKLEGQARETYEAGCKAADTGDTDAIEQEAQEQKEEATDKAKQQCLDSLDQIPDEAARKQAEEACEKFGE